MATFAETMLSKYETLLQTATGLDSVTVDGQSVRYADVEAKYRYWKREVAREPVSPFRMDPLGRFGSRSPETRNRLSAAHSALCTLHFALSLRPPHAKK